MTIPLAIAVEGGIVRRIGSLALISALVFAGCTDEVPNATRGATTLPANAAPSDAAPSDVVADASYNTVVALRDAAVAAGLACPGFAPRDGMALAAEAADCSPSTVLMIYSSQDRRDEQVSNLKALSQSIGGPVLLVGPNWVVNADEAELERIQPKLGGIIDRSKS